MFFKLIENNRKKTRGRVSKQIIRTKKIVGKPYLSKTGKVALVQAKTKKEKAAVWKQYGKRRYQSTQLKCMRVVYHYN